MEIKKTSVPSSAQPEIQPKSEVSRTKSSSQNLIPDSFETSKSSDSNQSSAASSEPEKKAGQITSGILIKQMTAARMGETNSKSQQSSESSGKKELTSEQQSRVSNSDPRKENLKPSFFLQDARSKDEDRKNSGLQDPFAPSKTPDSEQQSKVNQSLEQAKDLIGKDTRVQDGSQKDFSNDPLLNKTNLHDSVQNAKEDRQHDASALGGQKGTDRLTNATDPTSKGPQQQSAYGKDMAAGGMLEHTEALIEGRRGALAEAMEVLDSPYRKKELIIGKDGTAVTKRSDGTIIVEKQIEKDGKWTINTTVLHPDGSSDTTVIYVDELREEKEHTEGPKSYDPENYTGNIPEAVKKTIDYFRQQAISQKPQSGGETAHTNDNAEADPTVGGSVSNLVVQQGNLGLLGNPGSATSQTGPSGGQGHVGSSQSGGNVDFDQDSGKVGYTGPTHQDDPGDVQFGPAEQPKEQTDAKKSEDSQKSSTSLLDPFHNKRQRRDN